MWWGKYLAEQQLGLPAFTANSAGLIPAQETKILQAVWCGQKKKKNRGKINIQAEVKVGTMKAKDVI